MALFFGGTAFVAHAQSSAPAAARRLITSAGEFWDTPDKQASYPIRVELTAYYYDPTWRLLWGECNGACTYWPVRGVPLPMHSGQRVRIEGTVIPALGIAGEDVKVTVLANNALPPPIAVAGILDDAAQLDSHWVTMEGYVVRQAEADSSHLELGVLSDGHVISLRVQVGSTDPIPQLVNARVRVNFVYVAARDPTGKVLHIDGWIPARSDVTLLGWMETDSRFDQPPVLIERIGSTTAGQWLHVLGKVEAYDPDHSVTVRDSSGQLLIRTQQPISFEPGDLIEVIGRASGDDLNATLSDPCCRVIPRGAPVAHRTATASEQPLVKLRLADQVMALRPDEAAQHITVDLRGVVTWSDPKSPFFFIQDRSGGVLIRTSETRPLSGTVATVVGQTTEGKFAPEVEAARVRLLPTAELPGAQAISLDEALTGSEEARRVEMRGFVHDVEQLGEWTRLDLTATSGEFTAYMAPNSAAASLVGTSVRITGVCMVETDARRQPQGVRLWVTDLDAVQVVQPKPADPFTAPERSIATLRQSLAMRTLERPVRVTGTVVYDKPGRYLFLQQRNAALLVLRRDTTPVQIGQWIEAVGLPGRDGSRLVLRDAVWRPTAAGDAIEPLAITDPTIVDPDSDGRLVTIRGRLLETSNNGSVRRLIMRAGDTGFNAVLENAREAVLPRPGSVLELTGVYVVEFDQYRRPNALHVELRSPADIRIISAASWWTASRALAIAGALAVCTALGIAWVVVLRRRVRQQTAQIRAQLEKQVHLDAEIERAARLESLGVLAGGIAHDFNNLLTVVIANLGLAAMDERVQAAAGDIISEAERGAHRAAELTQQLLTFAKGGDPVRRAVNLPDVVRESAEFARHGSLVRCVFEVAPDLPPAEVDRGQISRVVHNLVLNATQAMPEGGVIRLGLSAVTVAAGEEPNLTPGQYVKLTVADEGRGIAPEHLKRVFEPYFSTKPKNNGLGLATVHSIVKKHKGHIRVRSEVGHGTTFDLWLPAAIEVPSSAPPTCAAPCATGALRVLFMDDDEIIRRTASMLFQQLGHVAKVVGDGLDVVREYESALNAGRKYDVVVLDLTVPGGLGGRAAMEILRRMDPSVRGIVSSGYSNDPVLANYQAYGFCAVVPKPYLIDDLARAIQEVATMTPPPVTHAAVASV